MEKFPQTWYAVFLPKINELLSFNDGIAAMKYFEKINNIVPTTVVNQRGRIIEIEGKDGSTLATTTGSIITNIYYFRTKEAAIEAQKGRLNVIKKQLLRTLTIIVENE